MDAPVAQSPFLPGTNIQFAWDSTSLGYLKTCPRLYQYTMIDGWGSTEESIHLKFGIEFHQALQDFDIARAEGTSKDEALYSTVRSLLGRIRDWDPDPDSRAGKYKNRQSLVRTVIDYLDHYADDAAKTVIMANGKPAVELSFRFELDWGPRDTYEEDSTGQMDTQTPYLLCGHLDRVVTFNDETFVMDRKTTTSTPGSYYFDQYHPNNQMTLYTLAGQFLLRQLSVVAFQEPFPDLGGLGTDFPEPAPAELVAGGVVLGPVVIGRVGFGMGKPLA